MTDDPADPRAVTLAAAYALEPWKGRAWRAHNRRYGATDYTGSLRASGRYHRAGDLFPERTVWPALYCALARDTCLAEINRQLTPLTWSRLRNYRFSELSVRLGSVLDVRDPTVGGLSVEDLCRDFDWDLPQSLAAAAIARGAEGMLVPSATGWGNNLIVFPDRMEPGSSIDVLGFTEPRLTRGAPI